jgi:hypothetical protein
MCVDKFHVGVVNEGFATFAQFDQATLLAVHPNDHWLGRLASSPGCF